MTLKEKIAEKRPDLIDARCFGGVYGCPADYDFLNDNAKSSNCGKVCEGCAECWNREYRPAPPRTGSDIKRPVKSVRVEIVKRTGEQKQSVVHCKECKYFEAASVNVKGFQICPASGMEITENDFCSYAVRSYKGHIMTISRAIQELEETRDSLQYHVDHGGEALMPQLLALEMAIDALKRQQRREKLNATIAANFATNPAAEGSNGNAKK